MPSFSNPEVDQGVQIVLDVDSLQPPHSPAESRVDFQREVGTGAIFEGVEMSASPAIKPEPRESRRPASLPAPDIVALALGMGDPQRAVPPTSGALVRHDDRLVLKDVDRLAGLTQSFGKDFQSMNKAAFIAIAKEVARLERFPDDRESIFFLMDTVTTSNLSSEEKETIFVTAVTSGIRRMQLGPPLSREERAVVFAGLSELGNVCSEESARMLLQVAKHVSAEISGKKQDDATASLNNLLFLNNALISLDRLTGSSVDHPRVRKFLLEQQGTLRYIDRAITSLYTAIPEGGRDEYKSIRIHLAMKTLRNTLYNLHDPYEELTTGDFNRNIQQRIADLGLQIPFFARAQRAIHEKGFSHHCYNPSDDSIPLPIRQTFAGASARTYPTLKAIYYDLKALRSEGTEEPQGAMVVLDGAIANECVHVIYGTHFKLGDPAECPALLAQMKASRTQRTEKEQVFVALVHEELLSQMVDDIIRERTLHPNYFANEKELRSSGSVHDNFLYRRDEAITMCFRRIFGVGLDSLDREGEDIVTSRLEAFKASGEIEKMLTFRLRDLKLLP